MLLLQGQALPEPAARALFQQLMVAVDYCHRLGIANRDIKVHKHAEVRVRMCAQVPAALTSDLAVAPLPCELARHCCTAPMVAGPA